MDTMSGTAGSIHHDQLVCLATVTYNSKETKSLFYCLIYNDDEGRVAKVESYKGGIHYDMKDLTPTRSGLLIIKGR